jgi:hypothetical protein
MHPIYDGKFFAFRKLITPKGIVFFSGLKMQSLNDVEIIHNIF